MEVTTGTVVDGVVRVEGDPLMEGSIVTVLVDSKDNSPLTPEQKALLARSMNQAEQGRVIDGWELLQELKPSR